MTYKYNPFWQQRIRETVRHALNVHPRLTALRVDLRFPDVPAATDAAVISRFINALKARIDAYQKRKHREGKRVHPTTLHYVWAREFGGKRTARAVLTGMCYSAGSAMRHGSSSLTRLTGQSAMTPSTWRR